MEIPEQLADFVLDTKTQLIKKACEYHLGRIPSAEEASQYIYEEQAYPNGEDELCLVHVYWKEEHILTITPFIQEVILNGEPGKLLGLNGELPSGEEIKLTE